MLDAGDSLEDTAVVTDVQCDPSVFYCSGWFNRRQ